MQPIFVMSSERSGSNLVRRMLGAHPRVAAPPPPHLWRFFAELLAYYGTLDGEASRKRLLADMLKLTRVPESHLRWKHELSEEEVLPRVRRVSLSGLAGALYESYAAREEADFWVCKENNLFDHAFRIVDVYPESKFVYLARDGRDVACSIKKVPTHDQHAYYIAREWRDEQLKCIDVYQELLSSERSVLLRYEELIADPGGRLRELCAFAGLEFDQRMLEFHEERDAQEEAGKTQYWTNLAKPVMSGNKAKFLTELTPREITIFETVAGDALELLGYPLHAGGRTSIGGVQRLWYRLENKLERRRMKKQLFDEPGRKERAQTMRAIHRGAKNGDRKPLAPTLSYGM